MTTTAASDGCYLQVYDVGLANPAKLPEHVKVLYRQAAATVPIANLPLVRLFCIPVQGDSKAVYIYDAVPYCYMEAPEPMTAGKLDILKATIRMLGINSLVSCETVDDRIDMAYYQQPKQFIKVSMADPKDVSKLRKIVLGSGVMLTGPFKVGQMQFRRAMWECDVQFYRRVCIDAGVVPFGWLRTRADAICSKCGNHIFVRRDQLQALGWQGEHARISPSLRICSYDIECINAEGSEGMVVGTRDPCVSIAAVTYIGSACSTVFDSVCFVVRAGTEPDADLEPPDGVSPEEAKRFRTVVCPDERTMLVTFSTYVRETAKPNIMTGYNIDRFDWKYLLDRASVLHVASLFEHLSTLAPHDAIEAKQNEFHSSAVQSTDCTDYRIPGILNVDVFRGIFREKKLREYTLKYVSATFLAKQDGRVTTKKDLPYQELPRHFNGDRRLRWVLADYNEWDARLVGMLIATLRIIENYIAVARVTSVDIHELITGGQQTKVHTQLLVFARGQLLIPTIWRPPKNKDAKDKKAREAAKYKGAIVIEPIVAFYQNPITTLDFSSLYPSIMISANLSHDTRVLQAENCIHGNCMRSSKEALLCGCVIETPYEAKPRFVSPAVRKGVLPRILEALLSARSAAKKDMAAAERAGDPAAVAVFDALQLALKISANSVYGFTGALNGKLPCMEVSASVTAYGRVMIETTASLVERHFVVERAYDAHAQIVYGDSVTGDTPVMLRNLRTGLMHIVQLAEVGSVVQTPYSSWHDDKEQICPVPEWQVWSGGGWSAVVRFIRHRAPGKQLMRVLTHTGVADVTEDHSLLDEKGAKVRPTDIKLGDALMHRELPAPTNVAMLMTPDEAFACGSFMARSSSLKRKSVPTAILNSIEPLRRAFLDGFCAYRGTRFDCKGKIGTAGLLYLASSLGYSVIINYRSSKFDVFHVTICSDGNNKLEPPTAVRRIQTLHQCAADEYVYDVETADHTFAVGPGKLVVHNTDSVMIKFGVTNRHDAFAYGKKAERLVNAFFNIDGMGNEKRRALLNTLCPDAPDAAAIATMEKEPLMVRLIDLLCDRLDDTANEAAKLHSDIRKTVLEKVAERMLLISKKRYAMMKYLSPNGKGEVHQSGIESVRRDNCVFVAQLVGKLVDSLMQFGVVQECVNIARDDLTKLTRGKIPFSQLVYTKALKDKKEYADGTQVDEAGRYAGRMPQIIVNEKRIRRKMRPHHIGDRVPYVLVQPRGQAAFAVSSLRKPKLKEIVEDPDWAQENGLLPNINYYLGVLIPPLRRIFDTALGAGATARFVLTQDVTSIPTAHLDPSNRFFGSFLVAKRSAAEVVDSDDDAADSDDDHLRAVKRATFDGEYAGAANDTVVEWQRSAPKQRSINSYFSSSSAAKK